MNDDTILVHHGIKGMKWGVRRYRNKDGSLTAEGKLRSQKRADRQTNRDMKREYKRASKNRRALSTKELQSRIQRLEMEKKLKTLTEDNVRSSGEKVARDVLKSVGSKVAKTAIVGGTALLGRALVTGQLSSGVFDLNDANAINPAQIAAFMFPNPNKKK